MGNKWFGSQEYQQYHDEATTDTWVRSVDQHISVSGDVLILKIKIRSNPDYEILSGLSPPNHFRRNFFQWGFLNTHCRTMRIINTNKKKIALKFWFKQYFLISSCLLNSLINYVPRFYWHFIEKQERRITRFIAQQSLDWADHECC